MTMKATYEMPSRDTIDARMAVADQPGHHLWVMLSAWHISDPRAAITGDATQLLDQENLIMVQGPGCFKCEQPFSNRLARKPCYGNQELQGGN